MKKHISYSEIKTWDECAYKHKLVYIDEIKKFLGNEHTAFGTAVHEVCEKSVLGEISLTAESLNECFDNKFLQEIQYLTKNNVELNKPDESGNTWKPLSENELEQELKKIKDEEGDK